MLIERPVKQIKQSYGSLSEHQRAIADFILANVDDIASYSISALAENCGVSNTTVIRFLNKLGYQSYPDFKMDMVRELGAHVAENAAAGNQKHPFDDGYQSIRSDSSTEDVIHAVTLSVSSYIRDMDQLVSCPDVNAAVELLLQADNLLFYGTGGSSAIAMDGFHKFLRLGLSVYHDTNLHLTLIRIVHLTPRSVVVLFSHTGESYEVLACAKLAHKVGCKVIGITSYTNCSLAKQSDLALHSAFYDSSHYTDALVSRLMQLVLTDILYITVSLRSEPESTRRIQMSREAISTEKHGSFLRNKKGRDQ